ncbi:MAG TPA: hypothetical protein VI298_05325 [Geobacteraceae bacterium]
MKAKIAYGLVLSFLALVVFGCGGGGGGGAGGTTVSGTAAKGLINGGTVKVFEIISSQNAAKTRIGTTPLGQGTTAADGSYSVNIGSTVTKGGLLVQVTGGTYKDEATGNVVNLADKTGAGGMHAAFGNISGAVRRGTGVVINVTPFTDLGVQALPDPAHPTDANIAAANALVSATFPALHGVNIITTKPIDVAAAPPSGATAAQLNYSVALATVSELLAGSTTVQQLSSQFLPDVLAGTLSSSNLQTAIAAELNFLNSADNKTGATGTALGTMAVTVNPSATAAQINANVTLTANVTLSGAAVPDGTQVAFAVKSGTGTLSATSAVTSGGVASVTLTSGTDGATVIVTASAGGVSADAAAVTFSDPNRPASVTVTANPTSADAGASVAISASVKLLSGAAVPDGTTVNFVVTSGTGQLSAAGASTTGGIATVNLTSAAGGTVVVKATAGAVSDTVSVPFVIQSTLAIVKVQTSGALPAGVLLGGISASVSYPAYKGLSIASSDVVASGYGAGAYFEPIVSTGNVGLVLLSQTGFPAGEFATLTFQIAPGNFPMASDFSADGLVEDSHYSLLSGMTITIKSVTFQ